jgi:citrate lyase subunit beta/citryl-CoA lyase
MTMRSLLFVPGDRPERFPKAAASGADALILDLEDSVSPENKPAARAAIAAWLGGDRQARCFVRINPLDSDHVRADLDAVLAARPDGIMLPKALGSASVRQLVEMAGGACPPILPIASETPAAVFGLGSYGEATADLAGLTWGAEDLPAAIGAATSRNPDGSYTQPYEVVRALTLFGAHAAGVAAIETVYPNIADIAGLEAYVARGRRDGFTGMMAIHPSQVAIINAGFSPSEAEIAHARAVIAMFAANPGAGALKLDGKMIDRPHLKQAEALLDRAGAVAA